MLDLNQIRADFAAHLGIHANRLHSLDAALMHVVERAYQQGLADAYRIPDAVSAPMNADHLETEVNVCIDTLVNAIRNAHKATQAAWGYALLQTAAQIEPSALWRQFLREALAEVVAHYEGHH